MRNLMSEDEPYDSPWKMLLAGVLAPECRVQVSAAAGCPVIVKPSEETPLYCLHFVQILYRAGLPRESAQVGVTREFAQALAVIASELRLGDPTVCRTQVGPLIRRREMSRVDDWVSEAIAGGGIYLCRGAPRSETFNECKVLLQPRLAPRRATWKFLGRWSVFMVMKISTRLSIGWNALLHS